MVPMGAAGEDHGNRRAKRTSGPSGVRLQALREPCDGRRLLLEHLGAAPSPSGLHSFAENKFTHAYAYSRPISRHEV